MDTTIITGYRSLQHKSLYFGELLEDFIAVTANRLIFFDFIQKKIISYFKISDQGWNSFLTNTIGLSIGFISAGMIFGKEYSFKACLIDASLVSAANYVVKEFSWGSN